MLEETNMPRNNYKIIEKLLKRKLKDNTHSTIKMQKKDTMVIFLWSCNEKGYQRNFNQKNTFPLRNYRFCNKMLECPKCFYFCKDRVKRVKLGIIEIFWEYLFTKKYVHN